jgi:hypothetical protein
MHPHIIHPRIDTPFKQINGSPDSPFMFHSALTVLLICGVPGIRVISGLQGIVCCGVRE